MIHSTVPSTKSLTHSTSTNPSNHIHAEVTSNETILQKLEALMQNLVDKTRRIHAEDEDSRNLKDIVGHMIVVNIGGPIAMIKLQDMWMMQPLGIGLVAATRIAALLLDGHLH